MDRREWTFWDWLDDISDWCMNVADDIGRMVYMGAMSLVFLVPAGAVVLILAWGWAVTIRFGYFYLTGHFPF